MRYLMFNLVVGAALFYLMAGDGPAVNPAPAGLEGAMDRAAGLARQATERASHLFTGATPPASSPSDVAVAPAPDPKAPEAPPPPPTPVPAVESDPLPAAETVPDPSPEVLKRRAEVLSSGSSSGPVALAEGEPLMTPRERRRELDALVEEMELFYFTRVGN